MEIIDLSVVLNKDTPVYPGDPKIQITAAGDIEKDGWTDHLVSLGTHTGTHIDAPLHMIKDGKKLDEFPTSHFVGRGKYINAQNGEFDLAALKASDIKPGDIVLFHTGMSEHFREPMYYENYPVLSEEVARYLVEQKVSMVGLDTGSADNIDGFPIHQILLGGNVLIIENLTNLAELAGKEFTVYALPIKLQLDGAPARVIARID